MKRKIIETVQTVEALDFPKEILDWCDDNDISTHYASEIIQIRDDGNLFSEWLKENGYDFEGRNWGSIGIYGT